MFDFQLKRGEIRQGITLIEVFIVISILAFLTMLVLPKVSDVRSKAQTQVCRANLQTIQQSKEHWAFEETESGSAVPTGADLVPFLQAPIAGSNAVDSDFSNYVKCPGGGTYTIGAVDELPSCSVSGHDIGSH